MMTANFFEAEVIYVNGQTTEQVLLQGYLPKNVHIRTFLKKYYPTGAILWVSINPKHPYHYGGIMVNKEDNDVFFAAGRGNCWECSLGHDSWCSGRQPKF